MTAVPPSTNIDIASLTQALSEKSKATQDKAYNEALAKMISEMGDYLKTPPGDTDELDKRFKETMVKFAKKYDKEYKLIVEANKQTKKTEKTDKNQQKALLAAAKRANVYASDMQKNMKSLQKDMESLSEQGFKQLIDFNKKKKEDAGEVLANIAKGNSIFDIAGKKIISMLGENKIANNLLAIKAKSLENAEEEAVMRIEYYQKLQSKALDTMQEQDEEVKAKKTEEYKRLLALQIELGNITKEQGDEFTTVISKNQVEAYAELKEMNKKYSLALSETLNKQMDSWVNGSKADREFANTHLNDSITKVTNRINDNISESLSHLDKLAAAKNNKDFEAAIKTNNAEVITALMNAKQKSDLDILVTKIENGTYSNIEKSNEFVKNELTQLAQYLKSNDMKPAARMAYIDKIINAIQTDTEKISGIYKGNVAVDVNAKSSTAGVDNELKSKLIEFFLMYQINEDKNFKVLEQMQDSSGNFIELITTCKEEIIKSREHLDVISGDSYNIVMKQNETNTLLEGIKDSINNINTTINDINNRHAQQIIDDKLERGAANKPDTGAAVSGLADAVEVKKESSGNNESGGGPGLISMLLTTFFEKFIMPLFSKIGKKVLQFMLKQTLRLMSRAVLAALGTVGAVIATGIAAYLTADYIFEKTGVKKLMERFGAIMYDAGEFIYETWESIKNKFTSLVGYDNSDGTELARQMKDKDIVIDEIGNGDWKIDQEKAKTLSVSELRQLAQSDKFGQETKTWLLQQAAAKQAGGTNVAKNPNIPETSEIVNNAKVAAAAEAAAAEAAKKVVPMETNTDNSSTVNNNQSSTYVYPSSISIPGVNIRQRV